MTRARTTGPLPEIIGPYVIAEKIGSGGMATVYRAFRPDGQQVAVKVLAVHLTDNDNLCKRFEREVVTLRQLKHPHILPLEDAGHDEGRPYFVMPLMAGDTLADQLKYGPLPPGRAAHFVRQIASALDYAHAHKVIHRDIKPGNILIDAAGNTYLADFGVAHLVSGEQDERLTSTGEFIGTVSYAPPEQTRGEVPDRTSDLYALAVMTFEMLTGKLPFEGATPLVVMKKHFHDPVPNPREINASLPPQLYDVLTKGMAKTAAARYRSALEFSEALDMALGFHTPGVTQADDDDEWLHPPAPVTVAPPPAEGFDPDSDLSGAPDDPFAGFDTHTAPPADDFDDHFDADAVLNEQEPPAPSRLAASPFTAEPIPDPEPEMVAPRPPLIRPLGKVPPVSPRKPFPWARIGIYAGVVGLVMLIALIVLVIYRQLNPPGVELDARYQSASLGLTFQYPAAWYTHTDNLAILSDQNVPTILISDRPMQAGDSLSVARLVIAVQRIDPVNVYSVDPACRNALWDDLPRTFECMSKYGYVIPDYQKFSTKHYRGAKLPGSLPVQRASLPVILLPTNSSSWVAVIIVYWDGVDGARDLTERLAKSVRIY